MIIGGVDTSTLPDQFETAVAGRTLIVDGDGPAYRAAATVKTVPTAVRRFQQEILTWMYIANADDAQVYLTHEESRKAGRFNIKAVKPYQGQRNGSAKPPLLSQVRHAVTQEENFLPEYTASMEHLVEADDAMIIQAYSLKDDGIIASDDKDLRMTPYKYLDLKTGKIIDSDPFGHLEMTYTESGVGKLVGHSLKFFWAQMLMGDSADNIKGILKLNGKLCGPAAAYEFLHPMKNIEEVANAVIGAYREIDQNPLPEGYLLWLLRHPHDSFWNYLQELPLLAKNVAFLNDCVKRDWFTTPEDTREED